MSASRITRLSVQGFRRLANLSLEMRPLTVVIGANGCGKSSLLDVFSLLSACADKGLKKQLRQWGGLSQVLTIDHGKQLFFDVDMFIQGASFNYSISVVPQGHGFAIEEENLYQLDPAYPLTLIRSRLNHVAFGSREQEVVPDAFETALSQVPRELKTAELFRYGLASINHYHALDISPQAPVRLPQTMDPSEHPGGNGENLVSCLYYLRESDPDRFEMITDALRAAFPTFERLAFPPVAAGSLGMTWKDHHFKKPFYQAQMSEGMLRCLWLLTLLHAPVMPSILLLDEPEVSLHPEVLSLFVDLLREASQRCQIIVATHSERLVQFLRPEELLVMAMDDQGLAHAEWADALGVEHWLDSHTLDGLWRKNLLEGRVVWDEEGGEP